MNKRGSSINVLIGYLVAIIGIIGLLAWAVPEAKTFIENLINFKTPADTPLLISSIVIAIIGIFIIQKFSHGFRHRFNLKAPPKEVPIFQGKHIIGFRRRY